MKQPTASMILQFFALAKDLGVDNVTTSREQRDFWVYEISKKVDMVYAPNYKGRDFINGVEIKCED